MNEKNPQFVEAKILAVMVAMVMTLGLTATNVFAGTYSITITNAKKGETYNAYKVFDASYTGSGENLKVSYWIDSSSEFYDTVSTFANTDANGLTLQRVGDSTRYNVIADTTKFTDSKAGELAALLNADTTKPTVSGTVTPLVDGPATIDLDTAGAGYYLVDTTLGVVCALNTNTPTVNITDKNTTTTNDKTVEEGGSYGDKNDANVGDTVNFKSVVTIAKGQKNVVFHDKMQEDKLAFVANSVAITGVEPANYTIRTGATKNPDDTFTVDFLSAWTESLTADTEVTITYSATLTAAAIVGNQSGLAMDAGNDNKSKVTYGDAQGTEWDWTRTYTWGFDILKYTGTNTPLADAKFTVKSGDTTLKFTQVSAGSTTAAVVYRYDTNGTITEIVTPASGKIELEGLDAGTYTLTETEAPAGYNKLESDVTVVLTSNMGTAGQTGGTVTITQDGTDVQQVNIENKSGSTLPSTGGIGTTIFYAIGSILVVGAGVLLISKKRMFN